MESRELRRKQLVALTVSSILVAAAVIFVNGFGGHPAVLVAGVLQYVVVLCIILR